jgi:predicted nucleic-acid-binding protein
MQLDRFAQSHDGIPFVSRNTEQRLLMLGPASGLWKALRAFQSANADFADCVIAHSAASAGCEKTMTFDRGAAKSAGMTLIA